MWLDETRDNVFAKIVRREEPSAVVYEDDDVLAFMDAFPQAEGHVLIVSKTSTARSILDADPATLRQLIMLARKVVAAMAAAWRPDGVVVAQLNGAAAGQTVQHLHFHIIPRRAERQSRTQGKRADSERLRSLARELAAAMAR